MQKLVLKTKKYTYFNWINEIIEPITDDELDLTNCLIDLKVELKKHEKDYDEWINNYSSLLTELRLEKQGIICLLEERDDNNKYIVKGKERKDCIEYKTKIATKIDYLSKERKKFNV